MYMNVTAVTHFASYVSILLHASKKRNTSVGSVPAIWVKVNASGSRGGA